MTRLAYETRSEEEHEADPLAAVPGAIEELRSAVEETRTQAEERVTREVRSLTGRLDAIDLKLKRPAAATAATEKADAPTPEQRAFAGFVRGGRESLTLDEVRMLRVADEKAGGYLAPDQFEAQILRDLVQFSPIRAAARVVQTSAGAVIMPRRTARLTARWVGEIELRPRTEPAYGQLEIPVNEIACYVDVSNQLLEDAAVDIAAELAFDFAEEFGRLEGEAFVAGNGVKKPVGILADPAVPVVLAGSTTEIDPDVLITLMYSLPAAYRNRGAWLLNATTTAFLRKLKDGNGAYLWQASIADGQPPTLLGRPIIDAVDMPDVAANSTPIAYGDFASAYRIVDRIGLSVLRDPFSIQTEGQVRFHARKRVGGGVVRPEAIRKLKMAVA